MNEYISISRPLNQIGFAFEYRFENTCLKYKFNLENVKKKNSNQIHGETTFHFDSLKSENPYMSDLLGSVIAMMRRLRDFSKIFALCKLSAISNVCINELFLNHLTRLLNKLENETRSKNTIGKIQIFCH